MSVSGTSSESTKERWRTAGQSADMLEREVKARRNPLAAQVVSWFNRRRVCRDLEEQISRRSSVARCAELEAILQAQYELYCAEPARS
jgi:hypothetical protein